MRQSGMLLCCLFLGPNFLTWKFDIWMDRTEQEKILLNQLMPQQSLDKYKAQVFFKQFKK